MARRGQRASKRVQDEVRRQAPFGRTPTEIHRALFPSGIQHADYVTSKTIQRLVKRWRDEDAETAPRWSFALAYPDDAARLLDVVRWLFELSEGRVWLTQDTAGWVLRLRIAVPEMPPRWAWFLAIAYQRLTEHLTEDDPAPDSRALDLTLDAMPWAGEDWLRHWLTLLRSDVLFEDIDDNVLEVLETLAQLEEGPDDFTPQFTPHPKFTLGVEGDRTRRLLEAHPRPRSERDDEIPPPPPPRPMQP